MVDEGEQINGPDKTTEEDEAAASCSEPEASCTSDESEWVYQVRDPAAFWEKVNEKTCAVLIDRGAAAFHI